MVGTRAWRSGPQAGKEWLVPRTTGLAGMDPRRMRKSPPRPTPREHQSYPTGTGLWNGDLFGTHRLRPRFDSRNAATRLWTCAQRAPA